MDPTRSCAMLDSAIHAGARICGIDSDDESSMNCHPTKSAITASPPLWTLSLTSSKSVEASPRLHPSLPLGDTQ